ncbi:MAG: GNAT family N-acetyltransferase [Thermoplasmata archaeon]
MDESQFSIRSFTDSDFESYAELRRAARPNYPISAATLRQYDESFEANVVHDRFVAELRRTGQVVAIAGLQEDPTQAHAGKYWTFVFVRPEFQGQGIGSRLYDIVLQDARRHNGVCLRTSVQTGEAAGLAFSAHRGFTERTRDWQSVLDVQTADTHRLPSLLRGLKDGGIEVTTLAQEGVSDPRVVQRLYRLEVATSPDVPRMDPYIPWTLDQFRQAELVGPNVLPDGWFIAKAGDEYVAMSWAAREAADPDMLQQEYTCTLKEYRRRGVALTLKLGVIEYARRHGFRRIRTNNDSMNAPMWKLNEQLGFRRVSTTIQLEKLLS